MSLFLWPRGVESIQHTSKTLSTLQA